MKVSNQTLQKINNLIDGAEDIKIIPHRNPDGDAIGSSLALWHYLKLRGRNVQIIAPTDYPEYLKWFPGSGEILIHKNNLSEVKSQINSSDLIFFLDFNVLNRLDKLQALVEDKVCQKVLIDHHPHPDDFANTIISDTSASSTSELLYSLLSQLDQTEFLNKEIATCLYTGIITDTGSLSYNSSNPETYLTVARLMEEGIDKDQIHSNIYDNYSENRMKLLGFCLNEKMKVIPEFKAAYISIRKEELKDFNFKQGDSEGFVNYPLSIGNIQFSAIFIEYPGFVKASFRSKGNFPANLFSSENFNGGGHLNAAGGESRLSLDDTIDKFEKLLPKYKHYLEIETDHV